MPKATSGTRKPCCTHADNLVRAHRDATTYVDTCKVCACRHIVMRADKFNLLGQMTSLGRAGAVS